MSRNQILNELKNYPNVIVPKHGRGYFGIGIYGPKMTKNIGTLWRTADIFGADFMFTIGMQCLQPQRNTHRICTNKLFV